MTKKFTNDPDLPKKQISDVSSRKFGNKEIANLLRNVSAAHQVKGANTFQIRAYDLAAEAIEHASSDVRALWETGELGQIPGVGSNIANYIDELFTQGKVEHFEKTFKDIPSSMFELLKVPGVGPKTAYKLAKAKVSSIDDLEQKIKTKSLIKQGFGEKTLENMLAGIRPF